MEMKAEKRMTVLVALALMIVVLAARLLYLVDASLRAGEGYGLTGDGAIQTVPLLVLLVVLLWLVTGIFRDSPLNLGVADKQTIGVMSLMFVIGFYIGPSISIPTEFSESNMVGIIIIVIPILFISAMFYSMKDSENTVGTPEEE
jgi:membrane protease YdiL (CAAX protease family)|tara:strand:+ start:133 stop:567 length:435 start_codon:yes stop_codon:yes gene_type:complete